MHISQVKSVFLKLDFGSKFRKYRRVLLVYCRGSILVGGVLAFDQFFNWESTKFC